MKSNKKINIYLLEDDGITLEGFKSLLLVNPQYQIMGWAHDLNTALMKIGLKTDLMMMNIDSFGVDAIQKFRKLRPELRLLVYSRTSEGELIRKAVRSGANGFIVRNSPDYQLHRAIEKIVRGKQFLCNTSLRTMLHKSNDNEQKLELLTKREEEIMKLVASGFSNEKISRELKVSRRTVETHRRNFMLKLGTKSVTDVVRLAIRHKLLLT